MNYTAYWQSLLLQRCAYFTEIDQKQKVKNYLGKTFFTKSNCKSGNIRENLIFANSVKWRICDVKIRDKGMVNL